MTAVEQYLDELASRLRVAPVAARRLLAEVEDHLRDLVAAEEARDPAVADAESRALARFGTAREVARSANRGVAAALVEAGARLVAAGCAAVLLGTVAARLLAVVTSTRSVFGLPADVTPSPGRIAAWLHVQPGASDWRQAAALENADDALLLRGGAAVLGLLVALLVVRLLRGRGAGLRVGPVPDPVGRVGATAFGGAAALLVLAALGGGLGQLEWGRGQCWCDAAAAAVAAAAYGLPLLRGRVVAKA
jgi:hypothetical protein